MRRSRCTAWSGALLIGMLAPVAVSIVSPTSAFAANGVVTNGADGGVGSLRQMVANAVAGDVITFAWGVTPVALTSGPISINKNLTIRGNGAANTTITRSGLAQTAFRIFDVAANVTATIDMVTISNGAAAQGGGILNAGALTLTRSTVTANTGLIDPNEGPTEGAGLANISTGSVTIQNSQILSNTANVPSAVQGAGIYNEGAMSIANSSVSQNTATGPFGMLGGGIYNRGPGPVNITDTIISGNAATGTGGGDGQGGGLFHAAGSATLSLNNSIVRGNSAAGGGSGGSGDGEGAGLFLNSSATVDRTEISGNTVTGGASQDGGGLYVQSNGAVDVSVTITNSTIANNSAATGGSGVYSGSTAQVATHLVSVTVAGNTSGGPAVVSDTGSLTEKNTIVNNPGSATNCTGFIGDLGTNLRFGGTIGSCPGTTGDPVLGALADNGGLSQTMALGAMSQAIGGGSGCPAVDQRNYSRNGVCDIGAIASNGVLPDTATPVCKMVGIEPTNTKKQNVEATDAGRGLQSVTVVQNDNSYIVIPFFLPRTNLTVRMTAVKINQAQISIWRFNSTDAAAPPNTLLCQ